MPANDSAGNSAEPASLKFIRPTSASTVVVVIAPTYGMKLASIATAPHSKGSGKWYIHSMPAVSVPSMKLISAVVRMYRETSVWMPRTIDTAWRL